MVFLRIKECLYQAPKIISYKRLILWQISKLKPVLGIPGQGIPGHGTPGLGTPGLDSSGLGTLGLGTPGLDTFGRAGTRALKVQCQFSI